MKYFLILALLGLGVTATAAKKNSAKKCAELLYVEEAAKELRRERHIDGHDDVSTEVVKVSQKWLDHNMAARNMEMNPWPLERDEISKLYQCFHQRDCELYLVILNSSYHSGTGIDHHFFMVRKGKRKGNLRSEVISHTVYEE